jgi:type V secretory pathway adhesin AidA
MFSRIAFIAAAGLLAVACATNPAPADSGAAPSDTGAAVTPAPAASTGTATVANMAATTMWFAEEKLIPDNPALALVMNGTLDTDKSAGLLAECNAANGNITMYVGKQAAGRTGDATFRVRIGPATRDVQGKFTAKRGSTDTYFAFPITSADLLALGQPDMVSLVSDQGEVQWALVKNAATQVQAKYVGSMTGFGKAAADFLNYCNPK